MAESANARSAWESFYVIVGSSGAALIGLQFVVIALVSDMRSLANAGSIAAFGTPTVVHLGGALVISAIMSVPWPSLAGASTALAICGAAGIVFGFVVIARARRQKGYKPVFEDWLWRMILPCSAYVALTFAALFLRAASHVPLFVVGGSALSLLLIGIHNAWDTVTYIVVSGPRADAARTELPPAEAEKPAR